MSKRRTAASAALLSVAMASGESVFAQDTTPPPNPGECAITFKSPFGFGGPQGPLGRGPLQPNIVLKDLGPARVRVMLRNGGPLRANIVLKDVGPLQPNIVLKDVPPLVPGLNTTCAEGKGDRKKARAGLRPTPRSGAAARR